MLICSTFMYQKVSICYIFMRIKMVPGSINMSIFLLFLFNYVYNIV